MALAESQEVALRINAETSGQSDVSALVQQIEALAREGGEAGPRFAELAEQLKKVGRQQQLVTSFVELKRETRGYATELQKAQAATSAAMSVLREKRVAVDAATKSERDAAAALASAARAHERLKAEVAAARDGLQSLTARSKESGTETAAFANQIAAARARLADLRTASTEAGKTVGALKQAYDPVAQAMREAGKASREAESAFKKNVAEAQRLKPAYEKGRETLHRLRQEMQEAGINSRFLGAEEKRLVSEMAAATVAANAQVSAVAMLAQAGKERAAAARQQAQEEDRLAAIVAASKAKLARAAQEQLAAEKRAYAESEAAAKRYAEQTRALAAVTQNAFNTIGIRSSKAIQAEILGIQQGLQRLSVDAKGTGVDFDRAWSAAQKRIAALKAEMAGGVDPFTASVARASGGIGTFISRLSPVSREIAAAFSVDRVARTAVEFDSLNRTLAAIKGSGQAAAAELGYITATANRLGLELGSASKAYASFLAVTRGTALEGQGARDVFEAVAGSMARLGKSAADTDGAMLALSQMVSKGVVSMEELRQQLAERLPGALKAAADGAGLTEAELIKMVETGQVLAEDLLPAMAMQLNKLYGTGSDVQGYAASWGRLTSAVTNAIGTFTQVEIVMTAVTGVMAGLREGVLTIGTGFVVAAEGVTFFARALGTAVGAITSGNWRDLRGEIGKLADESLERINQIASQTMIAKGIQDAFTDSVAGTGAAAEKSGNGWLLITNAYAQANAAAEGYIKQSEKALKARQAESNAVSQYAQAMGDVQQQLDAEAHAAGAVAAAMSTVAEARTAQLATLQSQLAAQEQAVAADVQESDAKRKIIEQTRQKIELAREEAEAASAAARQSQMEAAAREAAAEAVKDNSDRLDDLRAAYEAAQREVRNLEEDERAGIATQDAVTAARARAVRAAGLYRDAVADTLRNIDAESRARQAQLSTEERLGQLKLAQIRRAEQSARATENEVAAAWRAVEAKRQEARMAELKARAQQEEARAQLAKIEAQERELTETERLDKAKMAELEAAKASATAKQIEGQISAELAKQLHAEADAAIRAMQAKAGAADVNGEVGDSAAKAAAGVTALNTATSAGGDIAKYFAIIWTDAKERVREASEAAYNAITKIEALTDGPIENRMLGQFTKSVDALRLSANQLVAEDPISKLEADITAAEAAADRAASTVESFGKTIQNSSLTWKGFWEDTQSMYKLEESIYRARIEHIKLNVEVERFSQAVDEGSVGLKDQERTLSSLVRQAEALGSQNLSELRSALADVRNQLRQAADDARAANDAIADEIDNLLGRYEDVERRRFAARRADLESRRDEAKADGNTQAVADFNRALGKLAELERLQLEQARQREKESAQRQTPTSAAQPAHGYTSVHRVEIGSGSNSGRRTAINTTDKNSADALVDLLRQLEADMARS